MSENVIQTSFSSGELSPHLFARVDFAKYRGGAATMRNFFVDYRSGASTRPGTEFIRPCTSDRVRLVRFQQSTDVTYMLEFGDFYLRFISNGSSITQFIGGIVDISNANPAHVVSSIIPILIGNGALIFISDVAGMPQVNNRYFIVANFNVAGINEFDLLDGLTGVPINSTGWGVFGGGGEVRVVYTIATPYSMNELRLLKFSQNANTMNITHPSHPPFILTLNTAVDWTLVPAVFGSTAGTPVITSVDSTTAGAVEYKYAVTAVDANNQESVPGSISILTTSADLRTTPGTNTIVHSTVPDAFAYNLYGTSPSYVTLFLDVGGLGFMDSHPAGTAAVFHDSNIAPDFTQGPPIHDNPFAALFPAVSAYFQQRLVFANGGGPYAATFWASKVGAPYNFDISNPTQANDAISGTLVSLEVNEIKAMIPMPTGLIAMTTSGVWQINGGAGGVATQGGPITPATATATAQAYIGIGDVPPIVVNYDIIFVQAKGSIIRDLTFNIYANIYTGQDISLLSSHLFYGHQIVEWAYAEEPFKVIWCVREDGILLGLTMIKEQEMYGWSRHDTFGNFTSVATVTEGVVDATYFAVERPSPGTGGGTVLQIERLVERSFPFGAEDAWCVDAGVELANFFPQTTLTVSAAVGTVDMISGSPVFDPTDVGQVVRVGGGIITITEFVNTSFHRGVVRQPLTNLIPNDPLHRPDIAQPGEWSKDNQVTRVFGLDHLEGRLVSVLADGGVVNGLVVQDGSITLPGPASKVVVGYGFQAQLQTMPLDLGQEVNTIQGKRKKVSALTVRVKDSRGVKAGMTFDTVTPIKELNRVTLPNHSVKLVTSDERIVMDPLWDVPGQICLQVDDPLPATILGVIPEVTLGDSGK